MSNLSLTGNPGTSLNFDGAELQNLQEAECRKEEEQQQNEVLQAKVHLTPCILMDSSLWFDIINFG